MASEDSLFRHPRFVLVVVGLVGFLIFEKAFDLGTAIPFWRNVFETGFWEAAEQDDFWAYLGTPYARLTGLGMVASIALFFGACCWPSRS